MLGCRTRWTTATYCIYQEKVVILKGSSALYMFEDLKTQVLTVEFAASKA